MAPQDYVKRGQAKKSSGRARKKKPTEQRPWRRIIGAVVLLVGFGFGLYFLQNNGVKQPQLSNQNSEGPTVSSVPKPEKKQALPVLKEEEWAFIDALPEYSVEVDIQEVPQSDKDYIMQCGSFRKNSQAEQLRAQIAFQGLEAEVIESNGANGRWYRVVLGPYDRKRQAESHRHQLRRGNILGCKIW